LLEKVEDPEGLKSMTAVIESQRQLEDVVENLVSTVHGVPRRQTIVPSFDTDDIT
jgi:2-C-methyl-D-erythritol 2,4-cyclodiphosphate synthase